MHKLITATLMALLCTIVLVSNCKAQDSLKFSAYEQQEQKEYELLLKQMEAISKEFQKRDSLHTLFIQKYLVANGVDLSLVSLRQDSFKISLEGIRLKLRKPKQVKAPKK